MLFILLSFIVVFLLIKGVNDQLSRRIMIVYVAYWYFALFLSSLGLFDFSVPGDKTYFYLTTGIVSFSIGFCLIKINRENKENLSFVIDDAIRVSKKKIFIFLTIVTAIFVFYYLKTFFAQIAIMSSFSDMREEFYDGQLYGENFLKLNDFLLIPMFHILPTFVAILAIQRKNVLVCLMSLFVILGYVYLGGGRFGYVRIALYFILVIYCSAALKFSFKLAVKVFAAIAILYIGIVLVTAGRQGSIGLDKETFDEGQEQGNQQIVEYAFGPVCAFDYAINNNYIEKCGGPYLGRLSLSSVDATVRLFLQRAGIDYTLPWQKVGKVKQGTIIPISSEIRWNALYTAMLVPYLDFGYFGLLILPMILGAIFRCIIKELYRKPTIYMYAILGLFFKVVVLSVQDYGLASLSEFITCFFLLCLHYFEKIKI